VKDERNLDKFDRVFGAVFKGLESLLDAMEKADSAEWLRKAAEKYLTEEEKKQIEAMGWDKLMETLEAPRRAEEAPRGRQQVDRHRRHVAIRRGRLQSRRHPHRPGEEPQLPRREGVGQARVQGSRRQCRARHPQHQGRAAPPAQVRAHRRAGRTRSRHHHQETANHGYLDVHMRPERRNAVKVLIFFDIGGSMDGHIKQVEELFSAAKTEFKHMEYFYFHNCLYEGAWKQNKRRFSDRTPTWDILHKYPHDYKVVFVGDASMSPTRSWCRAAPSSMSTRSPARCGWSARRGPIRTRSGSIPWRASTGIIRSTTIIRKLFAERMFPLTLEGLEGAMRELTR
jgi:hypothetical protein